jgi:hypothetical protein
MSVADRELTLADIITYNMSRPFEERKALLYGEGPTFQVKTLFDELPSFLVGGLPNFGKTSAVAFLACQMVMCGAQLVVIDPHMYAPRDSLAKIIAPLAPWYALPPIDFEDARQVVDAFQFVLSEYERRNRKNAVPGEPLFLICDEWNLLLDMLDDDELETVIRCVRTIARSARKFGIWLCLIAQNWNLDSSGGPEVRKSITGRLSFAQELSDMRMTLNTRDNRSLADLTSTPLGKGQCIFKHPSYGMKRVWYPPMDRRECEIVAQNMRSCLPVVDTFRSEYALISAKNDVHSEPEYLDTPPPNIKPVQHESTFPVTPQNVHSEHLNIDISESEYQQIVQAGNRQIQETGKVVRTRLRDELGWDNYAYEHKIKPVCDSLHWHHRMKPVKLSTEQKQELKATAGVCAKCGSTDNLEVDHMWPRSLGGPTTDNNLQVLCKACNQKKGANV